MTGLVISDLHLFAGRSDGAVLFKGIQSQLKSVDLLVLNGDTFDFRWSHANNEEKCIAAAIQ
ncbi:MAG: hypothetical protein ABF379_09885 [Akkermansiaceae bacterium]